MQQEEKWVGGKDSFPPFFSKEGPCFCLQFPQDDRGLLPLTGFMGTLPVLLPFPGSKH